MPDQDEYGTRIVEPLAKFPLDAWNWLNNDGFS